MASHVAVESLDDPSIPPGDPEPSSAPAPQRPRRRAGKVLLGVAIAVVLLVVAAALWFVLGRDQARELGADEALTEFRASASGSADAAGRPAAGVYEATASGTESIGLPGFDETLGPNAPVTVTYADGGCYDYRADFNSHHWRSWTFCPTATATFALTELESWTARKAPALDIETLTTYTCEEPLDVVWSGVAAGDTRTGSCTGTSDIDDSVTADAGSIEVLDLGTLTVGGETVDVVHARTTDTFSQAQTGTEVDEWWLDAVTGLPLRIVVDASLTGGPSDYAETIDLELSTLTPAT